MVPSQGADDTPLASSLSAPVGGDGTTTGDFAMSPQPYDEESHLASSEVKPSSTVRRTMSQTMAGVSRLPRAIGGREEVTLFSKVFLSSLGYVVGFALFTTLNQFSFGVVAECQCFTDGKKAISATASQCSYQANPNPDPNPNPNPKPNPNPPNPFFFFPLSVSSPSSPSDIAAAAWSNNYIFLTLTLTPGQPSVCSAHHRAVRVPRALLDQAVEMPCQL